MKYETKPLCSGWMLSVGTVFLVLAPSAMAITGSGCGISPENPTVVLGLLGAAAGGLPWLRSRLRSMRRTKITHQSNTTEE